MKLENHTILTKTKDEAAAIYFWKQDLYHAFFVLLLFFGILFIIEIYTGNTILSAFVNLFWNITFLIVLLGAIFLALRKKTMRQITQSYQKKKSFPIHYTFGQTIQITLGKEQVTLNWDQIRFIKKINQHYYLKTKQNKMYLIDGNGFASDEEHQAFLSYLNKYNIKIK